MPEREVLIAITSNNSELEKNFLDNKLHPEIKFVNVKKNNIPYLVFLIDLQKELTHISQNLIGAYEHCRENDTKLAVVLLHGQTIDIEKNHYFQKMLDDLGKDKPLHRLVFTKDVYQEFSAVPSTPFDYYIHKVITERKINISQKGENLFYPLSLADFINSLAKTLFLSNTSGKSFWILGDAIKDLELAYLLKKYNSGISQEELEINAEEKNEPDTGSLISVGNKSRGELNWQPEKEIVDDLKQIVTNYIAHPTIVEKEAEKHNPLHRFLTWVYKPRPKKSPQLPTVKKIVQKMALAVILIAIVFGGAFIIATGLALQSLNSSIKQVLNGEINKSVGSLNNSIRFKEMGESLFAPFIPLANLISPKETSKIHNTFSFINYSTTSLGNLHQTYIMAESLRLSLNNPDSNIKYSDLSLALHSNLSQIYENLNQISFLGSGNKLPKFLEKNLQSSEGYKNLNKLEEQVAQYIKIIDIIPELFSESKAKTILVLLQNSQLLQPSGGEIDYYLLLTLNKGKLISKFYYTESELEILHSAAVAATQKTKRFAVAPEPLLKDISQKPDFSVASGEIALYIEKATKIKPDFIIAINDTLIEQLLLEEKSQIIDQFRNDYIAASGSAVYKDLVDQYMERLFSQDISLPVLGRTIAKTIGDNQVLIWSSDNNTERLLSSQPYSGVIMPHPCNAGITSGKECLAETTYLSESLKLSTRKNPWESRQISHTIQISATSIQHEYQIEYKINQSPNLGSPANVIYHLYLPSPSSLNQALLNNLPASTKLVTKVTEGAFDHYQIPLSLSLDQDTSLIFKTTTFSGNNLSLPFSYSITELRQPGTRDSGTILKIKYPENLRPVVVTSQFDSKPAEMNLTLPPHTSTFGFTLNANTQ